VGAPALFGVLIGSHSQTKVVWGYFGAAVLLLIAAGTEALLGVKAEGQWLESISSPLSTAEEKQPSAA
jgi:hypothetical protein